MTITNVPGAQVQPAMITPENVARLAPQVQAQAVAPLTQRAVDPAKKNDRGNRSRNNEEKSKGGKGEQGGRGGTVNIRV